MTYSEQARSLDHLAASIDEKYEKIAKRAWVHLIFWILAFAWLLWISFNPDRLSVPYFILVLSLTLFSTVHWFFLSEFLWPRGLAVVTGIIGAWLLNALARPDVYRISGIGAWPDYVFISYGFVALGAIGVAVVFAWTALVLYGYGLVYLFRWVCADVFSISNHSREKSISLGLKKLSVLLTPIFVLLFALIWLGLFGSSEKSDLLKRRIMVEILFAEAVEGSPCFVEKDRRLFLDGEIWIGASQAEREGGKVWKFSLHKCEIKPKQEKLKESEK